MTELDRYKKAHDYLIKHGQPPRYFKIPVAMYDKWVKEECMELDPFPDKLNWKVFRND